jgi:hypothetical protein
LIGPEAVSGGETRPRALEAGGVEFTNGSEPGVKLKAKERGRKFLQQDGTFAIARRKDLNEPHRWKANHAFTPNFERLRTRAR